MSVKSKAKKKSGTKNKARNKILALAVIFFFIIASLSALGGNNKVTNTPAALPEVTANAGSAPTITAPTGTAPTTLESKDIIVGTGAEVKATSTLTVQYTLMTWSNGKVVESSWTGTKPATFPLTGVIRGWQQGLPGAKVGGRRLLVIPASLGYGANGSGPIGPNETLIFVVDIIGVA